MVQTTMKYLILSLFLIAGVANAEVVTFTDLKAYDGDTIKSSYVPIKGLSPISFRLMGIDTPEIRGKCENEIAGAIRARDFLNKEVVGKPITVEMIKWDKYGGRVIARVRNAAGEDLVDKLIAAGLGYPYDGTTKKRTWC